MIQNTEYSVYIVSTKNFGHDCYDEVTVIAKSPKEALKMCMYKQRPNGKRTGFFEKWQEPIKVELICKCDATKKRILTSSQYNPS